MAKSPTLSDITNILQAAQTINDNWDEIQTAFENTVSRDGSTPNQMEADLDLNSNDLLNVNVANVTSLLVGGEMFVPANAQGLSVPDWKGAWATSTSYLVNDLVGNDGSSYICLEAHTSGTFSTDLTANKWELFASKGTSGAGTGDMLGANNLSDVNDAAASRSNLGLGTAATTASTAYATAAQGTTADAALPSADKASQAQAEAGTNNDQYMTPLRTAQAITALGSASTGSQETFNSSGTWSKSGLGDDAIVMVEMWGAGEGGNLNVGGSGGAYNMRIFRAGDLTSTVAVTVGSGGATNTSGGDSSFGSYLTAQGGQAVVGNNAGTGGRHGPNNSINDPQRSGADGVFDTGGNDAIWGGASGSGRSGSAGGTSEFGGDGGDNGVNGSVPGGGGGRNASGANGRVIVTVF